MLSRPQIKLIASSSDTLGSAVLAQGDVVKIHLGAHIDGFASVSAETLIVGATEENPATGRQADVVRAAWTAAEAAMRTVKAGNKNWTVTEIVNKAVAPWGCKAVEGMHVFDNLGASLELVTRNVVMSAVAKCHRRQETVSDINRHL